MTTMEMVPSVPQPMIEFVIIFNLMPDQPVAACSTYAQAVM